MRIQRFTLLGIVIAACTLSVQAAESKSNVSNTLVSYPENQFKTTDGRSFMSSKSGLYEVVKKADNNYQLERLNVVINGVQNSSCYFMGITQVGNHLLTACAVSSTDTSSPRHLLTLNLQDASRTVEAIGSLNGVALPNGLSANAQGLIVLADTGSSLGTGKLLRIVLNNPANPKDGFTLKTWLSTNVHPNGVKLTGNAVYWSQNPRLWVIGNSSVSRTAINADLSAGATTQLFSKYGTLDDIALVKYLDKTSQQLKDGVLICEFANKKLTLIGDGATAPVIGSTTVSLGKPSSALLQTNAQTPNVLDIWVTEYDSGALVRLSQGWGLQPR